MFLTETRHQKNGGTRQTRRNAEVRAKLAGLDDWSYIRPMLYTTPDLQPHLQTLDTLADLRRRLGAEVARAAPWMGPLRRQARVGCRLRPQ